MTDRRLSQSPYLVLEPPREATATMQRRVDQYNALHERNEL